MRKSEGGTTDKSTRAGEPKRPFLRIAVTALAVIGGVLGILLLPPVQLVLFNLAARQVGVFSVTTDGISVTPWAVRVDGLHVVADGLDITVERGSGDIAFWSSLFHLDIDLADLDVDNAVVTVTPAPAATPASDDVATSALTVIRERNLTGLAGSASWPPWLTVRELTADLALAIEAGGSNSFTATLDVAATDWSSGSEAAASVAGQFATLRADETLAIADVDATATAVIGPEAAIGRLDLLTTLTPRGGESGLELAANADFEAGETYSLTLTGIRGVRLADVTAALDPAGVLTADWRLELPAGIVAGSVTVRCPPI